MKKSTKFVAGFAVLAGITLFTGCSSTKTVENTKTEAPLAAAITAQPVVASNTNLGAGSSGFAR